MKLLNKILFAAFFLLTPNWLTPNVVWAENISLADLLNPDLQIKIVADQFGLSRELQPRVDSEAVIETTGEYFIKHYQLSTPKLGSFELNMKLPIAREREPRPALFLVPGYGGNDKSFKHMRDSGDNVVVEFVYPAVPSTDPTGLAIYGLENTLKIQAQMAVALLWAARHPAIQGDRINIVSVSLGTFLVPASIRLAQQFGFAAYTSIFAYGGADIKAFLLPLIQQKLRPSDFGKLSGPLAALFDFIDPNSQLPFLKGRFLVVNASDDEVIPKESTAALVKNLPMPKDIITVPLGHIGVGKDKLINQLVEIVLTWLHQQEAIN